MKESKRVDAGDLTRVAAALQKQVLDDFVPVWRRPATVDSFLRLEDVPLDYWPMIVRDDIPYDAQGIHLDNQWGPYSLILWDAGWSLTASHECLEMLADPYGRRLRKGLSPRAGQGDVQFLVEVCDPCEADRYAYAVNGVAVSDFYTSQYFAASAATGRRYSYTGSVRRPRQVLPGGYLSWRVPPTSHWWQQRYFGATPQIVNLGAMPKGGNPRTFTDRLVKIPRKFMRASRALRAVTPRGRAAAAAKPAGSVTEKAKALRANVREIAGVG